MPAMQIGTITIERRFRGPPASANGGYTAGRIAAFITGSAEVTLRAPPPIVTPMRVEQADGIVTVLDDDVLIAEARSAPLSLELTQPVPYDEAVRASAAWPARDEHPFPWCFVCGPAPGPDEGLGLHPWWVDQTRVAAPWEPHAWAADDGVVRPEIVWAALDCPSAWTWRGEEAVPLLLGRLTADLREPIGVGERISVVSWPLGGSGRKFEAATALFDEAGHARAVSRAIWIMPRS
jgi:hypothetical protein